MVLWGLTRGPLLLLLLGEEERVLLTITGVDVDRTHDVTFRKVILFESPKISFLF